MSRKLLGDFAALLGGLRSPTKRYNKKKEKESDKERKEERNKPFRQDLGAVY